MQPNERKDFNLTDSSKYGLYLLMFCIIASFLRQTTLSRKCYYYIHFEDGRNVAECLLKSSKFPELVSVKSAVLCNEEIWLQT